MKKVIRKLETWVNKMPKTPKKELACLVKELDTPLRVAAAVQAMAINPCNRPLNENRPSHLAVLTTKYWGTGGVNLTVGFMEPTSAELRNKILSVANLWGNHCNVKFSWTQTDPQVRISRGSGGYWSYLGTDVLAIPKNQPTMNLEGFTLSTPDKEYLRVVVHEMGHTLGFPHEHARKQLVDQLDREKTIQWGQQNLGWSRQMVIQQILTPLEESSIMGTPTADQDSIMCYMLPASITKTGQPIRGGGQLSPADKEFAAKVYPSVTQPPPPPPPGLFLPPVLEARDKPGADGKTIAKYVLTTMPGGSV